MFIECSYCDSMGMIACSCCTSHGCLGYGSSILTLIDTHIDLMIYTYSEKAPISALLEVLKQVVDFL